jgi:ethanolamine ammonia-lyase small subunit
MTIEDPKGEEGSLRKLLSDFTAARVGLGRSGAGLPTREHLRFQRDHALARDAVHSVLDVDALLAEFGIRNLPALGLHSAAADRRTYLQRPDLGRRLDDVSRTRLADLPFQALDVMFVLADGLSATAIHRNALPLLDALLPLLPPSHWKIGPIAVVAQGRVAIGDEIAVALGADLVVVLIGERPGLSSPDSLGVYLTWQARPDTTDAERNCLSNIRSGGLPHLLAASRLLSLMNESRRRRLSGVGLKEESPALLLDSPVQERGLVG